MATNDSDDRKTSARKPAPGKRAATRKRQGARAGADHLVVLGKGHAELGRVYAALRPGLLHALRERGVSSPLGRETPAAAEHIAAALDALPPHLRALFPYSADEVRDDQTEIAVLGKIAAFGETLVTDAGQALAGAKGRLGDKTSDFLGRVETLQSTLLTAADASLLYTACVPLFSLVEGRREGIRAARSDKDRLRAETEEARARSQALEAENQLLRAGAVVQPAAAPAPRAGRRARR